MLLVPKTVKMVNAIHTMALVMKDVYMDGRMLSANRNVQKDACSVNSSAL